MNDGTCWSMVVFACTYSVSFKSRELQVLMHGAGDTSVVTEKHSNYLASRMGADSRFYASEMATAVTMMALSAYDESTDSTQPDLALTVNSDPVELLSAEFAPGKQSIVQRTVRFDELETPPKPLTFLANGNGACHNLFSEHQLKICRTMLWHCHIYTYHKGG